MHDDGDFLGWLMVPFFFVCLFLLIHLLAIKLDVHILIVIQYVIYIGVLGMGGFIVGQWDSKNIDDNFRGIR